jgi:phosphoribosylformylglycinamidine cyclo-ligase
MPGMYGPGHYDLAGFCVGVVEADAIVDGRTVVAGDVLVGLPSSGVHYNGFSLVRKLVEGLSLEVDPGGLGGSLGETLLAPTRIYVKELLSLHREGVLKGAVHITGGGFYGNIPRMLPEGLGAEVVRGSWPELPVFEFLRQRGDLSELECFRTFNNGIGMVLILSPEVAEAIVARGGAYRIGAVVPDPHSEVHLIG